MKTLIVICCICMALTQQCLGDETLFTCTGEFWYSYIAEGGLNKPGWEQTTSQNVIKLIQTETGSSDIRTTDKSGTYSPLKNSCDIKEILDVDDIVFFDHAFVVKCKKNS